MGMFDGMNEAAIYERNAYFPPGFQGELRLTRAVQKAVRKGGDAYIAEFEALTSNHPDVPVGSKRSWYQGFKEREAAFGAIKELFAAFAGISLSDMPKIQAEIFPISAQLAAASVGPENILGGMIVHLETFTITTKHGTPFTKHKFSPSVDFAAKLPEQYARIRSVVATAPTVPAGTASIQLPPGFKWGPGGSIVPA